MMTFQFAIYYFRLMHSLLTLITDDKLRRCLILMQDEVDSHRQIDILAEHDRLIKRLRTLAESEETTCSDERSLQVSFLAGQQEPNIGRLDVVQRDFADNHTGKYT